jgi:Protein of unknown function (DUF2971)
LVVAHLPTVLYHYTSQVGLLGILQKKELWATQIQYLNDETEFSHAWSVLLDSLPRREEKFPAQLRMVEELTRDIAQRFHVCVCSFSTVDGQLSQWRGYCKPGSGFSLGFWAKDLKSLADKENWQLAPCIYDPDEQRKVVSDLFNKHSERYSQIYEHFGGAVASAKEPLREQLEAFVQDFVTLAPRMKHPSFGEEAEWRLISPPIPSTDLQFREGRHTLVPYFPLKYYTVGPCPLQTITVGPGTHPPLSIDSVRSLLFRESWATCEVRPTQGTLRDWG